MTADAPQPRLAGRALDAEAWLARTRAELLGRFADRGYLLDPRRPPTLAARLLLPDGRTRGLAMHEQGEEPEELLAAFTAQRRAAAEARALAAVVIVEGRRGPAPAPGAERPRALALLTERTWRTGIVLEAWTVVRDARWRPTLSAHTTTLLPAWPARLLARPANDADGAQAASETPSDTTRA